MCAHVSLPENPASACYSEWYELCCLAGKAPTVRRKMYRSPCRPSSSFGARWCGFGFGRPRARVFWYARERKPVASRHRCHRCCDHRVVRPSLNGRNYVTFGLRRINSVPFAEAPRALICCPPVWFGSARTHLRRCNHHLPIEPVCVVIPAIKLLCLLRRERERARAYVPTVVLVAAGENAIQVPFAICSNTPVRLFLAPTHKLLEFGSVVELRPER